MLKVYVHVSTSLKSCKVYTGAFLLLLGKIGKGSGEATSVRLPLDHGRSRLPYRVVQSF